MLVYREVPGIFGNCKTVLFFHLYLPALFRAAAHRRHRRRRRGEASRPSRPLIRRALSPTRRADLLHRSLASRWPFQPVPRAQNLLAAATATPPWRARRRAPGPLPARARAPQRPQRPIPLFLLLSPRPQTQEHHRRHPPNAGEPRPPLNSPLRPSPPQINPSSSSYVVPRGSPTLFSSPILHRSVASADADRRRPPGYAEPSPQAATSRPEAT